MQFFFLWASLLDCAVQLLEQSDDADEPIWPAIDPCLDRVHFCLRSAPDYYIRSVRVLLLHCLCFASIQQMTSKTVLQQSNVIQHDAFMISSACEVVRMLPEPA